MDRVVGQRPVSISCFSRFPSGHRAGRIFLNQRLERLSHDFWLLAFMEARVRAPWRPLAGGLDATPDLLGPSDILHRRRALSSPRFSCSRRLWLFLARLRARRHGHGSLRES